MTTNTRETECEACFGTGLEPVMQKAVFGTPIKWRPICPVCKGTCQKPKPNQRQVSNGPGCPHWCAARPKERPQRRGTALRPPWGCLCRGGPAPLPKSTNPGLFLRDEVFDIRVSDTAQTEQTGGRLVFTCSMGGRHGTVLFSPPDRWSANARRGRSRLTGFVRSPARSYSSRPRTFGRSDQRR